MECNLAEVGCKDNIAHTNNWNDVWSRCMNIFEKGGVDILESDLRDVKSWDGQGYAWHLYRCYTRIMHTKQADIQRLIMCNLFHNRVQTTLLCSSRIENTKRTCNQIFHWAIDYTKT